MEISYNQNGADVGLRPSHGQYFINRSTALPKPITIVVVFC